MCYLFECTASSSPDVAFAYFSMSYEEMVYAHECHAFLTGMILDSRRLESKDCVVKLVHHLWVKAKITGRLSVLHVFVWSSRLKHYPNGNKSTCSTAEIWPLVFPVSLLQTGHMGVDSFVQELLTAIRVRPRKKLEKQETLLQWVKVTTCVFSRSKC